MNGQKAIAFWASLSLGISSSRQSGAGSTQDGGLRMLLSVPSHLPLLGNPGHHLLSTLQTTGSFYLAPNPLPGQPSLTPSQILNFFFLSVPKAAGLGLVV